jgi:hypothetical protein
VSWHVEQLGCAENAIFSRTKLTSLSTFDLFKGEHIDEDSCHCGSLGENSESTAIAMNCFVMDASEQFRFGMNDFLYMICNIQSVCLLSIATIRRMINNSVFVMSNQFDSQAGS